MAKIKVNGHGKVEMRTRQRFLAVGEACEAIF